ncbi:MAG: thioredoxin [Candidatus Margulisiibacteriota bacterium]
MSPISSVDEQSFKTEVLESTAPVLVDFWAQWCGPCLMLGPVLEKVAVKYSDRLKVRKLNVDENKQISADYQIMSIPCLIIFRRGMEIGRIVGFMDENNLSAKIDATLSKGKI